MREKLISRSYDCQSQDPFILVVNNTLKFIDFIGVDRFDLIVNSYLVNLYNYMKTKEKEIQVDFFIPLMSCKEWKVDQRAQAFEVFVYLKWKISDFKDKL